MFALCILDSLSKKIDKGPNNMKTLPSMLLKKQKERYGLLLPPK